MSLPSSLTLTERESLKFRTDGDLTKVAVVIRNGNDEAVPVIVTSSRGITIADYNESIINTGEEVTIISKTIALGKEANLLKFSVSAQNVCELRLAVNGNTKVKARLTYTDFNFDYDLQSLVVSEGDIVTVIVENKSNASAFFNSTLFYSEYDL